MPEKSQTPQPPQTPPPQDAATPPARRQCGVMIVHERLMRTDARYVRARAASENHHVAILQGARPMARTGITSIPVVVHVVHNTAAQNISDAQINSQIEVLNRDFRKTNPDVNNTPAPFLPLAADARIQFTLATTDPQGNPTTGITRTQTNRASFSDNDEIKSAATGGHDAWPADRYLNIWTAPRLTSPIGDLLGYAQFPGGPAATDGVVILHSAFGTTGTAAPPFNLGRTTTHEVGHYLNLRHIWGDDDEGCNGSDFVSDTPNQAGSNFGTPTFPHVTCGNGPNGDMFMNYMDYVDDAAMFMFTTGQVVRMQACLDGDRSTLGSPVQGPVATAITADLQNPPTVKPADDLPTSKFIDDPITLKVIDDGPTFKPADDLPTLKFGDDGGGGTLKFGDDGPTLKFREDLPTLKFRDEVPKFKIVDDGIPGGPGGEEGPFGPGSRPPGQPGAAPFVLSTPHHSMAWVQSFPQAAEHARTVSMQQIQQYEQALQAYAQANAAGQLSPQQRQQADALYQDYLRLVAEFKATFGG